MIKITLTILSICLTQFTIGQSVNEKLIQFAEYYRAFYTKNTNPSKPLIDSLHTNVPDSLRQTANFIQQSITIDNSLLHDEYLSLPNNTTLKNLYIVFSIHNHIRENAEISNIALNKTIDSLTVDNISRSELVGVYYAMLFNGGGSKINSFNFSKTNFNVKDYNLKGSTEEGIFFLNWMIYCGQRIFSNLNLGKHDTRKAYQLIKKFPKFNGLEYYKFKNLSLPDFEIGKGTSYKSVYISRFFDVLLMHLECLKKKGANHNKIQDLLYDSILMDENYDQYFKNREKLKTYL